MTRVVFLALLLAGCGGSSGGGVSAPIVPTASVPQPEPAKTDWQIGPWIGVQDYSKNLPLHPTANPDGSFYFDIGLGAEPHYVTGEAPSFAGKTRITATFRVDAKDPSAQLIGANCPTTNPARLTLYFEKKDDDPQNKLFFSNGGRWWAEFATVRPIPINQEFTITVSLDASAKWNTVFAPLDGSGRLSTDHPDWFNAAKADVGRVGFTFGNCGGAGHGAWASSPVRFTVISFSVQ